MCRETRNDLFSNQNKEPKMLPMFLPLPMMGVNHDQNCELAHAVARRLLADLIAKKEVLAGQIEAKEGQLRAFHDQIDAMRSDVEVQLPKLLKPVFKNLGLNPNDWTAHIYDLRKAEGLLLIDLHNKTDKGQHKQVDVPMPETMKSKCVEWAKARTEQSALEKQSNVLHNSISARFKKMEVALYDLMMQRQAEAFLAKLPKRTLAKLKAIAKGE